MSLRAWQGRDNICGCLAIFCGCSLSSIIFPSRVANLHSPSDQYIQIHRSWRLAQVLNGANQIDCQSSLGIMRSMNSSNMGTVKAVSPWLGLQIIPLEIS